MSPTEQQQQQQPFPLEELRRWLPSNEIVEWLKAAEEEEALLQQERDAQNASTSLFDDDDDDDDVVRVQEWSTSTTNPDGVFHDPCVEEDAMEGIRLVYVLSDSWDGFGDMVWSSSRHIANRLTSPSSCRQLLNTTAASKPSSVSASSSADDHPLWGKSFLELGAGAGIPSWAALRCGAKLVVTTDLKSPNRIRCLAESMERNWRCMRKHKDEQQHNDTNTSSVSHRVCPLDWQSQEFELVLEPLGKVAGENIKEDSSTVDGFDVIVAADCCYMPWWHQDLLDTIHALLSPTGVALIPFALQCNTSDQEQWKIMDRAKDRGFVVEQLESQQLSPPKPGMEPKQGLVHTLRLTKPVPS